MEGSTVAEEDRLIAIALAIIIYGPGERAAESWTVVKKMREGGWKTAEGKVGNWTYIYYVDADRGGIYYVRY